ncbi:kynureninase [Dentipellis sp. KUC8613]|nr:kynureninase [Dentipellis sp. KUC8613]
MAQERSLAEAPFRSEFVFPTNEAVGASHHTVQADEPCVYLCGNSLGLLPKRSAALVQEELQTWGAKGVVAHFAHPKGRDWMTITDHVNPLLADLVGAKETEVACMGTLTANLHLMMNVFYKPTSDRYKILCEGKAFPSDQYAFASQARLHGLDPKDTIIELFPRDGEFVLREEDILDVISQQGASIAMVLFSGVQYYTGQYFPMQSITKAAKAQGCICGWDLAHAIGNVPLSLHDWDVDFAVWCSYKYLNSGPGGIAGIFVHEKWDDRDLQRYAGWWGHDQATRFDMPPVFSPIRGAQGFQQSNPPVLCVASLLGSLQVFKEAGMMGVLRKRSVELTGYLERRLMQSPNYVPVHEVAARYPSPSNDLKPAFTIITPSQPESRGSQLSLKFLPVEAHVMMKVYEGLKAFGVIGDERQPDVIRLAPTALYNTPADCDKAATRLDEVFSSLV